MLRFCCILLSCVLLSGCNREDISLKKALQLREKLLAAQSCTFDAGITAQYNNVVYQFQVFCAADAETLQFTVTAPETISGIRGTLTRSGGEFVFEDTVLAFPAMAEGRISPVSAPWIFYNTLKGGYLHGCGELEEGLLLTIDDSYADEALQLHIYLDAAYLPVFAEIYWQQQKLITLEIQNFSIQ